MRIIMINDEGFAADYSIEAAKSDGKKHFDHHGDFSNHVAPCKADIPVAEENSIIQISHVDADTFIGLLKLTGNELPDVDFNLMEQIDLNGSSVCKDKFDKTLLYMIGIDVLAGKVGFPRASDKEQDVSELIQKMIFTSHDAIIHFGKMVTEEIEANLSDCCEAAYKNAGLWIVGADQHFDPSRPYEEGVQVVVVYREHYKSVSVYCDPKFNHTLMTLGKVETCGNLPQNYKATIDVFRMCGHEKAAGTERMERGWSHEDARKIFKAIINKLNPSE